jgi:dephospho-CoA kinase
VSGTSSRRALRIGLTGGIGSGKSTVAGILAGLGAGLVDTDAIARALAQPGGAAMPAIEAAFGAAALAPDGGLDRARMREIVFNDADAKRRLEAILHPMIGAECERQAADAATSNAPAIVFDVPLLVESGRWRSRVDRVLVVDATEATQLRRVVERSGWTPEAVGAVIAQQATRARRRAAADAVVFNDNLTLEGLAAEVRALWRRWVAGYDARQETDTKA